MDKEQLAAEPLDEIYSPKINIVFLKLFSSEGSEELLLALINSVLSPDMQLTSITVKNPYNFASYVGSKSSILDVKAIGNDGTRYDVEMQVTERPYYGKRAAYYGCKLYVDQLEQAGKFSQLCKTIGIHLLNFNFFDDDRFVRCYLLKDSETNEYDPRLDNVQIRIVELNKAPNEWSEIVTPLQRLTAFLNHAQRFGRGPLPEPLESDSVILSAMTKLREMSLNPEEREYYVKEAEKQMLELEDLEYVEERGVRRGAHDGKERLVIRLLSRRVGDIPLELTKKLDSLTADELDDLGVALLDFTTYEQVQEWLAAH